jgi:NAD(P)-dependent dehydrogenase (short-subunit alcohol dehydrogenase family)
MVRQKRGVVLNIASIAGLIGESNLTAYSASKGALCAFTRALAVEWARHGVRVLAIAPGYFHTELSAAALDEPVIADKLRAQIPLRRFGDPAELGPLVVYAVSDAAAFMTGAVLTIDGGQTAR